MVRQPAALAGWLENAPDSAWWYHRLLLALSVIGCLLVLRSTATGGLSLSSDSVNYIAAARSLVSGSGLLRFHSDPYVQWGPLYPLFLAALDVISRVLPLDFVETIRFANAILYGITIYFAGRLFQRYLRFHVVAYLAVIWVVGSAVLLRLTILPLSELPFYLLTILAVLYWPRVLEPDARPRHYVIFGLLVTLVPLLRFAGYSLIPMVMLSILLFQHTIPLIKRIRLALMFALTGLPLALWLMYVQTTEEYRRLRGDPVTIISDNLSRAPRLIAGWFVPEGIATPLINLLVVAAILLVIVWLHWHYYWVCKATGAYPDLRTYPLLVAFYGLVFFVGMMAAFIASRQPLDPRHMSVLYIFILLLVFYLIEQVFLHKWSNPLIAALMLLAGVSAAYPLSQTHAFVSWSVTYCCQGDADREIEVIRWLRQNLLGAGRCYSNTPLPIMYTDLPVFAAPRTPEALRRTFEIGEDVYLIWFTGDDLADSVNRPARHFYPLDYDPRLLADAAEITVVADLRDGQILRFRPLESGQVYYVYNLKRTYRTGTCFACTPNVDGIRRRSRRIVYQLP